MCVATLSRLERFWTKVTLDPYTNCWNWCAGTDRKGYGNFHWSTGCIKAHRAAWYLLVDAGLDPEITLDHRCRNTGCVNPSHLEPCERAENSRRRWDGPTLPSWAEEHGEF
jgi:hypothetical protein